MEIVNKFFEFEIKNHLFDIVDEHGLRPWESVRYEVMMSVLYKPGNHVLLNNTRPVIKIWHAIGRLWRFFSYLFRHRYSENLFFLCSRDKKDGLLYDKISDRIYTIADKRRCFTLDSTDSYRQPNYKYGHDVAPDISCYLTLCSRHHYDFSVIYSLIKRDFPHSSITVKTMSDCYKQFVVEYNYFRWIFKWRHVKRAFLVQNGIRKGMMAAANTLGVKLIELQHGQISYNHPAYSYPSEDLLSASMIYHPDYLLTFGTFWSKNRHYPGVVDWVVGNESYADSAEVSDTHGNKKLLVISNLEEGELLAQRVEEVLKKDPEFFFYFKLHPNQFMEYNAYKERFMNNSHVEVVSNQMTINQLLARCEGIFLNDSTVELEALRVGRKVFVLLEQYWQAMDFVLDEEGIYACKDVDEFLEEYQIHKDERLSPRNDLFSEFDEKVARMVLQI